MKDRYDARYITKEGFGSTMDEKKCESLEDFELRKNAEGYNDTTAYRAIINADADARANKLLHTFFHICELAGFVVEGRITLRDRKTGRIYN